MAALCRRRRVRCVPCCCCYFCCPSCQVEATKPHSSRTASAEIFVACRDYKAPDKIDPRLLDPRFVFKDVDDLAGTSTGVAGGGGGKGLDVFHKHAEKHYQRQREGYDETLGPLLTRRVRVIDFVRSSEPIKVRRHGALVTAAPT